ncbi:helix-turn-helix domain-containing protein [Reyranella soli]|nr:helix-turn-helix domain-containing protein [Reyranella soli]
MDEAPSVARAFDVFERARSAYVIALAACRDAEPPRVVPAEVIRHLFQCGALVFACYCHPSNWPEGPLAAPAQPLPPMPARICAAFASYIAAGTLPGPISDALRRGAPKTGPEELRDEGWAVAYALAAVEGVIVDGKPTATVAEEFGVEPRTVRRWKVRLAAAGVSWTDMVPAAVPAADQAQFIADRMRAAGQRYLKQGRLATPRRQ